MFKTKRVYERPEDGDGLRVLVDRIWPRGVSRDKGRIDLWLREIAPSDSLRKWFAHREDRWEEFKKRYLAELKDKDELVRKLRELEKKNTITLLYAARDSERNNAQVLLMFLEQAGQGQGS